jgi:hypothetical protein
MSTPEVIVSHIDKARDLLQRLRAITTEIGGFVYAPDGDGSRRLAGSASVPDEFIDAVIVAAEASPQLLSAVGASLAMLRDAKRFVEAYRGVADELELLGRSLRYTMRVRRARAGTTALQIYQIAKQLNRPSESTALVPHIRDMRRALGKTGRTPALLEPPAAAPE